MYMHLGGGEVECGGGLRKEAAKPAETRVLPTPVLAPHMV
jgi:hypothetical protein